MFSKEFLLNGLKISSVTEGFVTIFSFHELLWLNLCRLFSLPLETLVIYVIKRGAWQLFQVNAGPSTPEFRAVR